MSVSGQCPSPQPSRPSPPRPAPYFSAYGFASMHVSCKWQHTVCGLSVWLLSRGRMFSRFMHVAACVSISWCGCAPSFVRPVLG